MAEHECASKNVRRICGSFCPAKVGIRSRKLRCPLLETHPRKKADRYHVAG